jgi:hypothetical protein
MAIIYSYPTKATPVAADMILISDSADNNKTKQITVESIKGLTAGVTQIIAGTNVTIDPVNGTGNVTINASGGGGTPGGSDTQMQYNNGGSFGGTTGLTWDDSTNILYIGTRFEGDIDGAVLQQVLVKEPGGVSKGDVVYISGGSGDNPEVRKAQANSISTMAALGIMKANTAEDVVGECVTTGEITGLNLTGFTTGDELFVSNAVAGELLTSAPAGEANLVQKIGKVIKGGAGGALTVLGAFRTNATPNLNQGSLFIGDASNQTSTLAIGATSGHVLTSNGTTASWAAVPASFTSLTLAGDIGTPQTINDGDTITIAGGTGIQTAGAATDTINVTNTDRGSSQNIFKTVAVSGQPNVIANVNNDTLNLIAGAGVTLTTDAAGQSVQIEATAATIPTTGWNPINIPSGTGYNFTTGDSVMLQVVAEATFVCSKMKFFAEYGTGAGGPNMRFDIYQGQLKDPSTGLANGTWLGGGLGPGSPTADAGGIIEISVSGEAPVQITAGQNYVIYFRTSGGTYNILSAPSVALIDNGVAIGGPNGGSLTAPQIDLQSEITSKVFNATKPEARLRPCCHLYNI